MIESGPSQKKSESKIINSVKLEPRNNNNNKTRKKIIS